MKSRSARIALLAKEASALSVEVVPTVAPIEQVVEQTTPTDVPQTQTVQEEITQVVEPIAVGVEQPEIHEEVTQIPIATEQSIAQPVTVVETSAPVEIVQEVVEKVAEQVTTDVETIPETLSVETASETPQAEPVEAPAVEVVIETPQLETVVASPVAEIVAEAPRC